MYGQLHARELMTTRQLPPAGSPTKVRGHTGFVPRAEAATRRPLERMFPLGCAMASWRVGRPRSYAAPARQVEESCPAAMPEPWCSVGARMSEQVLIRPRAHRRQPSAWPLATKDRHHRFCVRAENLTHPPPASWDGRSLVDQGGTAAAARNRGGELALRPGSPSTSARSRRHRRCGLTPGRSVLSGSSW